jgi:branched-chain amino acid transport system permease protein
MTPILTILFYGIITGSLYALVALGYSLIYSILRFVNFAHGEMITIGVYLCWFFGSSSLRLPLPLAIILSVLMTGVVSFLLGKAFLIPARRHSSMTALVVAIGISIIIQNLISLLFESDSKPFYPIVQTQKILAPELPFKLMHLGILFLSLFFLGIVWFVFLKGTRIGLEIRGCASNPRAAYIYGLRQNHVYSIGFFLSGVFAAFAGIAIGFDTQIIIPTMGFSFGLRAFIACVIGGITNLVGAITGAFILGILENFIVYLMLSISFIAPIGSVLSKDVIALILLALVLMWKPRGLFGVSYESRP